MKTLRFTFGCSVLLILSSIAASAQSVQTDYDRSANLSALSTYDFYQQDRKPDDPLAASPLNDRRIHNALDTQLRIHGFVSNSTVKPDFLIAYFVTARKGLNIQDNRFGLLQRRGNVNVNQVTEGTLVVVFADARTGQEIWRGFASDEIKPKDFEKDVSKAVAKLIAKFMKDRAGKK